MLEVVLSIKNYYLKSAAKIWQYTENHVLAEDISTVKIK